MRRILLSLSAGLTIAASGAAQRYTPSQYHIRLHAVEMSTDGSQWVSVLGAANGIDVDLADPAAFANALSSASAVAVGTYKWIRLTLGTTLVWSHPDPPVSRSDVSVTVNGPAGPVPGQMTAYFSTHDQGGRPGGDAGGDGTQTKPLLLGTPAVVTAGSNTVLRTVFAVSDTLKDQGGGNYDLGPPQMFFVAENDSASRLSGTFNTVLYNVVKRVDSGTVEDWRYSSGNGTLTFDGAGSWTWTGTTNDYDLLGATGSLTPNTSRSGRYGVNADGSFWMIATGDPGTLRGALAADGETLFASMYDSPSSHLMVFGVARATSAALANVAGSYYFTTYGSRYDVNATRLDRRGSFGIVNIDGNGGITGTQDANEVRVTDPAGTPTVTPPSTTIGEAFADTLVVTASGNMTNSDGKLAGGILESGDAACIGFDFESPAYAAGHEFGFLVRQSPAGTFTTASLNGSYFGGHFGDRYEVDGGNASSCSFSGFFTVTFDGRGGATVTVVENREGTVETQTVTQVYSVDTATGIVTFSDSDNVPGELEGAIGPGARSFVLSSRKQLSGQAAAQRFLGLALQQD